MTALSNTSGSCETPLLGDTIIQNLPRTVGRFPDREAWSPIRATGQAIRSSGTRSARSSAA